MADKPKEKTSPAPSTSSDDGHVFTFKFFIVILILLAISPFLGFFNFNNEKDYSRNFQNESETQNENENFERRNSFADWLFPSNYELGDYIVSKGDIEVRRTAGGLILGLQKAGAKGRVIEGPLEKFNLNWWRVDFKDAPDGWVAEQDLTSRIGFFNFINFFPWIFSFIKEFLIFIGIIALILIIWISVKRRQIYRNKEEKKKIENPQNNSLTKEEVVSDLPVGKAPETKIVVNRRWDNIRTLINSHNLNDWKQAILEADIILDEMLEKMGYQGSSVGEKLKQIEPSDFLTLNEAWEAHKFRNKIAHEGLNYRMSKDEAERVIDLYEKVFKEFYFI